MDLKNYNFSAGLQVDLVSDGRFRGALVPTASQVL